MTQAENSGLERWYTVAELAELTGFKKSAIYAAIRNGLLRAVSPNGGTRYRMVSASEWNRYLREVMGVTDVKV